MSEKKQYPPRAGKPEGPSSRRAGKPEGPSFRRDGKSEGPFSHAATEQKPREHVAPAGEELAESDEQRAHERPRGATSALMELDLELMKLLVRRAKLVSRMRGGREYAATPAAIQAEKSVRVAFERNALAFSKDPRFTRQLFSLLQDLKVLSREESQGRESFNLAPQRKKLAGSIFGPASARAALMWGVLAGALGKPLLMERLPASRELTDGVKALSQTGAALTWEPSGSGLCTVEAKAGDAPALVNKTLYLGEHPFILHLLAFAAVRQTGVCRLTGASGLKNADLSSLRNTLPLMGARLAHVVPRSLGLPANVECSGAIPPIIAVPGDLPLEGVCALLLAPLLWGRHVTIHIDALPAAVATAALAELGPVYAAAGAFVEVRGPRLTFTPGSLTLPERPEVPLDPAMCAYLLAMPAFVGGSFTLKGVWPAHLPEAVQAADLLAWAGLELRRDEHGVTAERTRTAFAAPLPLAEISSALAPLYHALAALASQSAPQGMPLPFIDEESAPLAEEFYTRVRLAFDGARLASLPAGDEASELPPWTCPDAHWAMAVALAAFIRPGLRLTNPSMVSSLWPPFWSVYNSLPSPTDPAAPAQEKNKEDAHEPPAPSRRRIIAD